MTARLDRLTDRLLWFLQGARDRSFRALRDEVSAIAQQSRNLNIHFAYSIGFNWRAKHIEQDLSRQN